VVPSLIAHEREHSQYYRAGLPIRPLDAGSAKILTVLAALMIR
jgi:hypothetical protein